MANYHYSAMKHTNRGMIHDIQNATSCYGECRLYKSEYGRYILDIKDEISGAEGSFIVRWDHFLSEPSLFDGMFLCFENNRVFIKRLPAPLEVLQRSAKLSEYYQLVEEAQMAADRLNRVSPKVTIIL